MNLAKGVLCFTAVAPTIKSDSVQFSELQKARVASLGKWFASKSPNIRGGHHVN